MLLVPLIEVNVVDDLFVDDDDNILCPEQGVPCEAPYSPIFYPTLPLAYLVCTDNAGLVLPSVAGGLGDFVVDLPALQSTINRYFE